MEDEMSTRLKRALILAVIAIFIIGCSISDLQKNLPKLGGEDKQQEQGNDQGDQGEDGNESLGNSDNPNRKATKKPKDNQAQDTESDEQDSEDQSQHEGGESQQDGNEAHSTQSVTQPTQINIPGDFVLTDDAIQVMVFGTGDAVTVNFQTALSVSDAMNYMQTALSAKGLSEDPLLTVFTTDTFSMVFNGADNGKMVVVQGVKLAEGQTNINIRYEE
jgi:hypothetical protein